MKKLLGIIFLLIGFSDSSNAGVYCKYLGSCSEACYYYNQGYYRLDRRSTIKRNIIKRHFVKKSLVLWSIE